MKLVPRFSFVALVGLCVLLNSSLMAGELVKKSVPSQVKWLVHLDVAKLKKSAIGEYIFAEIAKKKNDSKTIELISKLGFDPSKDVSDITLYSNSFKHHEGLMIVRGGMDAAKQKSLLNANAESKKETYKEIVIYSFKKHDHLFYVSFFDGGFCFSRSLALVKENIDLQKEQGDSLEKSESFQELLGDSNGFFFLGASDSLNELSKKIPHVAVLANLEKLSVHTEENGNYCLSTISVIAKSAEAALNIEQMLQGMVALGKMSGDKKPYLKKILDLLEISTSGNELKIKSSFPIDDIKGLHDKLKEMKSMARHPLK